MKNMILIVGILGIALLFGCTGQTETTNGNGIQLPGGSNVEQCTPSYSFSDFGDGTLGQTSAMTATVTCAAGKEFIVKLDGTEITSASATTNDTTTLNLDFAPSEDGEFTLIVESDDEVLKSEDISVSPIGNQDASGSDNDGVSFKQWRAVAFETDTAITPAKVKIYMKRIESGVTTDNIVVELRADTNGEPGPLVSSVEKPVSVATLTYNWINFDFADELTIPAGRYWIVMKVEEDTPTPVSDVFYVHYTLIDRNSPGNEDTIQMDLTVDSQTSETTETEWETLSFDREYAVVLTTSN
jgi:hypothetical protein